MNPSSARTRRLAELDHLTAACVAFVRDHVASLPRDAARPPVVDDARGAAALKFREPIPRRRSPHRGAPLPARPRRREVVQHRRPRLLRLHPGGRHLRLGARRLHRPRDESLRWHRRRLRPSHAAEIEASTIRWLASVDMAMALVPAESTPRRGGRCRTCWRSSPRGLTACPSSSWTGRSTRRARPTCRSSKAARASQASCAIERARCSRSTVDAVSDVACARPDDRRGRRRRAQAVPDHCQRGHDEHGGHRSAAGDRGHRASARFVGPRRRGLWRLLLPRPGGARPPRGASRSATPSRRSPQRGSFFLPYGTGASCSADPDALRRAAHAVDAAYLQDVAAEDDTVNFTDVSPELSRDFRGGLRLCGSRCGSTASGRSAIRSRRSFVPSRGWRSWSSPDRSALRGRRRAAADRGRAFRLRNGVSDGRSTPAPPRAGECGRKRVHLLEHGDAWTKGDPAVVRPQLSQPRGPLARGGGCPSRRGRWARALKGRFRD